MDEIKIMAVAFIQELKMLAMVIIVMSISYEYTVPQTNMIAVAAEPEVAQFGTM